MAYSLQPSTRDDIEDELIREALLKVQRRADLIAGQMGMSGVNVISLAINPGQAPRPFAQADVMMAARATVETAPSLEAGSSRVQVRINVEVELLP